MKQKIIFLLLFMLTFTMMHDFVMHTLCKKSHTLVTVETSTHTDTINTSKDFHSIHSMFHFFALLVSVVPPIQSFADKKIQQYSALQYIEPCKTSTYKPPIL